jgi:hypothetical protein
VRVRPAEYTHVGPPRSRLVKIGSALAGIDVPTEIDEDAVETVPYRTSPDGRLRDGPEFELSLANQLKDSAAKSDVLILDLSYDLTEVDGRIYQDHAISAALRAARLRFKNSRVLLIHSGTVTPVDAFVRTIKNHLSHRFVLGNTTTGELDVPEALEWTVPGGLAAAVKLEPEDLRAQLDDLVIRRRGVFEDPGQDELDGYRYSAERGDFVLRRLLPWYFERKKIGAVIYDGNADEWLHTIVGAATVKARIPIVQSSHDVEAARDGSGEQAMNPAALEAIKSKHVCIVIPMLKTGHNAKRLREAVESLGVERVTVLAVLGKDGAGTPQPGYYQGKRSPVGVAARGDFFVQVAHLPLQPHDWRVLAAAALGPFEDPHERWEAPSLTGMLALLDDLGSEAETNVPSVAGAATRLGIRWFPAMGRLELPEHRRDALWLAECLVRVALNALPEAKRHELLIVMPQDDGNGSRPIGRAIKNHLDVQVVSVPRGGFDDATAPGLDGLRQMTLPDEVVNRIDDHSGNTIVLMDESAISYGTFAYLGDVVRSITKNGPALAVAAVEAILPEYQEHRPNLRSLFAWRPVTRHEPNHAG